MATEQGSGLPQETEEDQRSSQAEGDNLEREGEDKPREPDFCLESILHVHHDFGPAWAWSVQYLFSV